MGDLIGYARVSTSDQDPALQLDALIDAGSTGRRLNRRLICASAASAPCRPSCMKPPCERPTPA